MLDVLWELAVDICWQIDCGILSGNEELKAVKRLQNILQSTHNTAEYMEQF